MDLLLSKFKPVTRGPVTRGLRNNNPGNIRHSKSIWLGQSEIQPDVSFVTFDTMAYGCRALGVTLLHYQSIYGLHTVREIINRWAPPNENNTNEYIRNVCIEMSVAPDVGLDLKYHNGFDLIELVSAIVNHENFRGCSDKIADDIVSGVKLALQS